MEQELPPLFYGVVESYEKLVEYYEKIMEKYNDGYKKNRIEEIFHQAELYFTINIDDFVFFILAIKEDIKGNEEKLILEMNRLRQIMINDFSKEVQYVREEIERRLEGQITDTDSIILKDYCKWLYHYAIAKYNDGKTKNLINDLYRKTYPYLMDNLDKLYNFVLALEDNLNCKSGPLLEMFSILYKVHATDHVELYYELLERIESRKRIEAKNIPQRQKKAIFNKLKKYLENSDKNSDLEGYTVNGRIETFWEENQKECKQIGWKKPGSLVRAYKEFLNPTKKKLKQLSYFEKYRMFQNVSPLDFNSYDSEP